MVSHRDPFWVHCFLIYINDLPLVLNRISSSILFADETSVIIRNTYPLVFLHSVAEVFNKLKLWFNAYYS
jgi:uncharacterized protein YqkB